MQRRWRWSVFVAWCWRSAWLPAAVASAPLLWLVLRELAYVDRASVACCDWAVIAHRTGRAVHFDEMLGPYSRYGWSHPGPAMFYALAPFYALVGRNFAGLTAGAAALNALWLAGLVLLCRRSGGPTAAWTAAVTAQAFLFVYGLHNLANPWNPIMVVLPAALLVVAGAAALVGVRGSGAVAIAAGSFAVQTHVGTAPMVLAVWGVVLLGQAVRWLPTAMGSSRTRGSTARLFSWSRLLGIGVMMAFWAPPLIEQVTNDPGNVRRIADHFSAPAGSQPRGLVLSTVGNQLLLSVRSLGGHLTPAGHLPPFGWERWLLASVLVVLVGLSISTGARDGQLFRTWLGVLAAVGSAAMTFGAFRVTDVLYPYLTTAAVGVGFALWLCVALFLADTARRVLRGRAVAEAGRAACCVLVVLLAVGGAAAVIGRTRDISFARQQTAPALGEIYRAVRGEAGEDVDAVHVEFARGDWAAAAVVIASLDGLAAVTVPDEMVFMFGPNPHVPTPDLCLWVGQPGVGEPARLTGLWEGRPLGLNEYVVALAPSTVCRP